MRVMHTGRRRAVAWSVPAALAAAWLAGCATIHPADALYLNRKTRATVFVSGNGRAIRKIALLPFKAPTELIGASVSDLFITDFMRARRYEMVERGRLASVLSEAELSLAGLSDAKAAKIGKMAGAQGVVVGTVPEYGTVAHRGKTYAVVAATLRLIDCESGSIVWSANLSARAESDDVSLSAQAEVVTREILAALYQGWRREGWHPGRGYPASLSPQRTVPRSAGRAVPGAGRRTGAAAPPAEAPPAAPGRFEATQRGLREVTLRWTPPAKRPSKFVVERSLWAEGGFQPAGEADPRSGEFRDRGSREQPLLDDTAYYYRLVAVSGSGLRSVPGAVVKGGTAPPPGPPPRLSAAAPALRKIVLTWEPSPDEGVVHYVVERAGGDAGAPFAKVAEVPGTRFEDEGPRGARFGDGQQVAYRVAAVNRLGARGPPTPPQTVSTRPPPGAVDGLDASGGLRSITLRWRARPAAESIARYEVHRAAAGSDAFERVAVVEGAAGSEHVDGGPEPGRLPDAASFAYRVVAVNQAGGAGPPSAAVQASTRGAPPAVEGLQALPSGARRIVLTWRPSSDEAVTRYLVVRHDRAAGEFQPLATVEGRATAQLTDEGTTAADGTTRPLEDGTVYSYSVAALNRVDLRSPWAKPVSARTKPAPAVPVGLAATTGEARGVRVSWRPNAEPDIRHYIVQGASAAEGPFATAGEPLEEPAFSETLEPPGRVRYYRVKAVDTDGLESAFTEPVAGRAKALPGAPSGLSRAYRSGEIELWWTPPAQADIAGYRVLRLAAGGTEEVLASAEPRCRLAWSHVRGPSVFAVVAFDRDGLTSARSESIELVEPAPPVPSGVSASSGGLREVTVSWKAPGDNAVTYRLERAPSPGGPYALAGTTEPGRAAFTDRGTPGAPLADGATYYYRVTALSAGGRASQPAPPVVSATAPPPSAPAALSASTPASRAVRLAWEAPDSAGVARYRVERANAAAPGDFAPCGEVDTTFFEEGGTAASPLADDTGYLYRVAAVNRVGSVSPPTEPVRVRTRPPPAPVQGLSAAGGEVRCVPLAWNASPEDDVVAYRVLRAAAAEGPFRPVETVKGRGSVRYLDGGADPGDLGDDAVFHYRVVAVNAVGSHSEEGPAVSARTRPVPPVVQEVRALAGRARCVPLTWQASPDGKVTGYVIERADERDAVFHEIASVAGREAAAFEDRGATGGRLRDGARYFYRAAAVNTAGARSPWSPVAEAATKAPPAPPAGVAASSDRPRSVVLTWTPNAEPDLRHYVVESSSRAAGGFGVLARVTPGEDPPSAAKRSLGDGEVRFFRVRAVDADGLESEWSEAVRGRAKPRPDAPAGLRVYREGGEHVAAWRPPPQPDCARYRVWRRAFLSWRELASVEEPLVRLDAAAVGRGITIAVSAVDADGLESDRSASAEMAGP